VASNSSPKTARQPGEYLFGLDAIRFLAALTVCVFHLTWLDPRVAGTAWFGWIGVQVFFVISGLVIANSAQDRPPSAFLRARVLRLYPAAWACAALNLAPLVVATMLQVSGRGFFTPEDLVKMTIGSVTLVPFDTFMPMAFLATAYWTLPIELVFYGLIFLMLLTRNFHRIGQLAVTLCVASSAYLIAYSLHVFGWIKAPWLEFEYGLGNLTLLRHGVFFGIGILTWMWTQKRLSRTGLAVMALAVSTAVLEIGCRAAEIVEGSPAGLNTPQVWLVSALVWIGAGAGIFASIRWAHVVARLPKSWLNILRIAGLSSYPLYLIHENVGRVPKFILASAGVPPLLAVVIGSLVAIAASVVVAMVAEPMLRGRLEAVWSKGKSAGAPKTA
jgi:peptidoglycan/LPS O-acetylase OafA/YrhL